MRAFAKNIWTLVGIVFLTAWVNPRLAGQDATAMDLFDRGQDLVQSDEFGKAAVLFQKCVEADDNFGGAWFMLGYALHMDKQYAAAIKAHRRAIQFDDSDFKSVAIYNLACALALTGVRDEALKTLQEAIDEGFDDVEKIDSDSDLFSIHTAPRFAVMIAKLRGKDDMAEQLMDAQRHIEAQEFYQAAEVYRKIFDKDPENDFVCYRLGFALHGAGKLDEAITYHERASKFPATQGIALYNWGCALSLQGKIEPAIEKLLAAVEYGFFPADSYETDPDLDNLRHEPAFNEVLAAVNAKRRELKTEKEADRETKPADESGEPIMPTQVLTWDNVAQMLEHEAQAGFAGAVLLVRNGEVALNQAYALANRDKNIDNTPETIFAIGSTPIDVTRASILLLAERGKLKLSDPISKFFPETPADKQAITIEHLMIGRSGLRDFHGLPSDGNPDHAWIDRDEAVRRILGQELLFEPGQGEEHSHSAFGLLAAIIEIASQQSYAEFTRTNLFVPAGMKDTGFFGEPIPEERLAVGYGRSTHGEINAPPFWGKTSWLVMGSGGQVSTTGDIHRWISALHQGKILSPESLELYFYRGTEGLLTGGDMFGFEILYTMRPDNFMVIVSNNVNSPQRRQAVNRIAQSLASLVAGGGSSKYSLGVKLRIDGGRGVFVDEVMPNSAAERDGLRAGDQFLKIGDEDVGDAPMDSLRKYLASGEKIVFEIDRDGQVITIEVKPNPR